MDAVLSGLSIIPKRMLIVEAIVFVFLVFLFDIAKSRLAMSEPAELPFGSTCIIKREFTVSEYSSLAEKEGQKNDIICKSGIKPSHEAAKGYTAICECNCLVCCLPFYIYNAVAFTLLQTGTLLHTTLLMAVLLEEALAR